MARATFSVLDRTNALTALESLYTRYVNAAQSSFVKVGASFKARRFNPPLQRRLAQETALRSRLDGLRLAPDSGLWWGPMTLNPLKAHFLIRELERRRPRHVLEAGSGSSTAILAALGKELGFDVLSLENHEETIRYVTHVLRDGEFSNLTIQKCGFVTRTFPDGRRYRWYNADLADGGRCFDCVVIDGPMSSLVGRNGALPEILAFLSEDHRIYLDDGQRPHERESVEEWSRYYPGLQVERPAEARGMAVLRVPAGLVLRARVRGA